MMLFPFNPHSTGCLATRLLVPQSLCPRVVATYASVSQTSSFCCQCSAIAGRAGRPHVDRPVLERAPGQLCPQRGIRTLQDSGLAPLAETGVWVVALSVGNVKNRK